MNSCTLLLSVAHISCRHAHAKRGGGKRKGVGGCQCCWNTSSRSLPFAYPRISYIYEALIHDIIYGIIWGKIWDFSQPSLDQWLRWDLDPLSEPVARCPWLQTYLLVVQEEHFEIFQRDPLLRSLYVPKGRRAEMGLETKHTHLMKQRLHRVHSLLQNRIQME